MQIKRYYPSSESFLLQEVKEENLYDYIFHGFALVEINGARKYDSFTWNKPLIAISQTPAIDEVMRKKQKGKNNNSNLIRLSVKLRLIKIYYGDNQSSWNMISKVLKKEEFKETIANYKNTINALLEKMFPLYKR